MCSGNRHRCITRSLPAQVEYCGKVLLCVPEMSLLHIYPVASSGHNLALTKSRLYIDFQLYIVLLVYSI